MLANMFKRVFEKSFRLHQRTLLIFGTGGAATGGAGASGSGAIGSGSRTAGGIYGSGSRDGRGGLTGAGSGL